MNKTRIEADRKPSQGENFRKVGVRLASEAVKLRNGDSLLNKKSFFLCFFLTYSLRCPEIEIFGPFQRRQPFFWENWSSKSEVKSS
jgi:hypothetical protein